MRSRNIVLAAVFFMLWGSLTSLALAATDYPTKPLEIIIPFPAGSGSDVSARFFADAGAKYFGQPIVVVNKGGGGGSIAVGDVISSRPDGYKVLWHASPYFATTYRTHPKLPFDVHDVVPLACFYEMKIGMAVRGDGPFKTWDDLREYGKKHPGELKWANTGRGVPTDLAARLVYQRAGINAVEVPYKGLAEAITALLGGHVEIASCSIGAIVDQVRAGKVRFVMVYSDKRYLDMQDVPTAGELGFPDAAITSFWGMYVRKDMPEPIKKVLSDLCKKVYDDPEFRKNIEKMGEQPRFGDPEFIRAAIKRQADIGVPILKELGLIKE
jgi:tripartite-type tricarboxylate transporter receptor subunit TctC